MARPTTQHQIEPALRRFAQRLKDEIGASRVLLFGSRARDTAMPGSDYDLIIVAERFTNTDPAIRGRGLRAIWDDEGGEGPMDLICLSPHEFDQAQHRISLVAAVVPEAIDLLAS